MSEPGSTGGELAFFGTITAGLSHELKNVIATINEYNGLLDDLAQVSSRRPLDPERLRQICGRISKQIERGESLILSLNRFAHSMDEPLREIDLCDAVTDIVGLCTNYARRRRVTLDTRLPGERPHATTDPFALQRAMHAAITLAVDQAGDEATVTVALADADAGWQISVDFGRPAVRPDDGEPADRADRLDTLAASLGATTSWGVPGVSLAFPPDWAH